MDAHAPPALSQADTHSASETLCARSLACGEPAPADGPTRGDALLGTRWEDFPTVNVGGDVDLGGIAAQLDEMAGTEIVGGVPDGSRPSKCRSFGLWAPREKVGAMGAGNWTICELHLAALLQC